MVSFEISVQINRPLEEVFAYLDDFRNLPEWNTVVEEANPSETPTRVGTKTQIRARFLGRKIESTQEVVEHQPNRRVVIKSDKPFPLTQTVTFERVTSGTKVTLLAEVEPGGFFKLGETIVNRIAKKQFQAQLDTLKEILEARTPAEVR